MLRTWLITVALMASAFSTAHAAEICGNAQDDDADGAADEGCYPALFTSQCESPLSCADTGMVSPSTGSLHYTLPPDVAPKSPWGPGIGFRRFYTSMFAPGGAAPAYRKPMGERWQHSYSTWLTKRTTESPVQVILHTAGGQDVLAKYTNTVSGWDNYKFQRGFHVQYLRQRTTAPNDYQLKTLTGEVMVYNSGGRLTEIWDTLAVPNKVLLAYDGNAQLSTVTDATTKRRLLFQYTGALLTSVSFQLQISAVWTTQHTTTYGYTGTALTSVTIGGELAQTNVYDGTGYLTQIKDGANNSIVVFSYNTAAAGRVSRVDTPRGMVGFELSSARTTCSGKSVLYFNRGNSTTCTTDTDCGAGFLCGGKTTTGATGACFRAARCMTLATHGEDVVTNVTALGPPGETCDGACLEASQYIWKTADALGQPTVLDLEATQDPSGAFITKTFDANGLPTRITYGDVDGDPSNGNGAREVFLFYNATFPGKLSEVRRKSNISTSGCSATVATGCARTTYTYTADGKLDVLSHLGFTPASYHYQTDYNYDTKGRLTSINGSLVGTGDSTTLTYYSSTNPLIDGFLESHIRATGTDYLTSTAMVYDFWGNATTLQDVDDTISCQTFSASRGYLTSRRETMAGQTDCTVNTADLETKWFRDSALRLTKMQRPDGSCMLYEYDTKGRLARTKRRDDCNGASAGDREEYTYDAEGLVTKIETFDVSNVVTRRREMTYLDSRRLEKLINPVNTSKWTGFTYDSRGLVSQVDGAGGLSKTAWTIDADRRVTAEKRYRTATVFDTWDLLYDWLGNQQLVTDDDHIGITSERDDLGRVIEIDSPDLGAYPTKQMWDAASRLTQVQESAGGPGQQTHNHTFDLLGRPLDDDYHGQCGGTNVADIKRTYDVLPTGVSCPSGMTCTNTLGRLAYVKTRLMCSSAYTDGSLDQETFYAYDAAGRLLHEHIRDDSGRAVNQNYEWTKSGALKRAGMPSGAVLGWTYGSSGSNSDTDRVSAVWRSSASTPIADNVLWNPYGPLKQYNQQNTDAFGNLQRTRITRNLAYRVTEVRMESPSGSPFQFSMARTEDDKGRTKSRIITNSGGATGIQPSHYTYDLQDRLLCETTSSGASCSSGTSIKNSHSASPPFTASGDWKKLLRPIPGSTGLTHDFTLNPGTHQLSQVNQSDGAPSFGLTSFFYDSRGNRSSDDNENLPSDLRSYSYDARGNVSTVTLENPDSIQDPFTVTSAFDASNRRVFKAHFGPGGVYGIQSHWFYYYDAIGRLTEVYHIPDSSVPSTYSVYQLVWIEDRMVLYWQADYPSGTESKRYVGTDETGRPVDMVCWGPGSIDCPRVWAINPSAWGSDTVLKGASLYQPLLFAGQYVDRETTAWADDGSTVHRPGLAANGFRTYDAFVGGYLQPDPLVDDTWSTYGYAESNPVVKSDPLGLATMICGEIYDNESTEDGIVYQNCYDTGGGGSSGPAGTGGGGGGGGGGGPSGGYDGPRPGSPPTAGGQKPPRNFCKLAIGCPLLEGPIDLNEDDPKPCEGPICPGWDDPPAGFPRPRPPRTQPCDGRLTVNTHLCRQQCSDDYNLEIRLGVDPITAAANIYWCNNRCDHWGSSSYACWVGL